MAAAFRHRTSRVGDPLLHTHVVVANATRGPDGRWTALDGRELYRHAKTAGYLYRTVLRAELTERLGVEWEEVDDGTADLRGVSRVIEHFLRAPRGDRRVHARPRRMLGARGAQVATLETRLGKDYGVPVDRLREHGAPAPPSTALTAARSSASSTASVGVSRSLWRIWRGGWRARTG